jgi:hypothetical protein
MNLPIPPDTPPPNGAKPSFMGNLPKTERGGIIFQEYVHLERKINGAWTLIAENIPAAFDPLGLQARTTLEPWSHKPLRTIWLAMEAELTDGDRLIRFTGERWYVRGMPTAIRFAGCVEAITEYMQEDKTFDPIAHGEPE